MISGRTRVGVIIGTSRPSQPGRRPCSAARARAAPRSRSGNRSVTPTPSPRARCRCAQALADSRWSRGANPSAAKSRGVPTCSSTSKSASPPVGTGLDDVRQRSEQLGGAHVGRLALRVGRLHDGPGPGPQRRSAAFSSPEAAATFLPYVFCSARSSSSGTRRPTRLVGRSSSSTSSTDSPRARWEARTRSGSSRSRRRSITLPRVPAPSGCAGGGAFAFGGPCRRSARARHPVRPPRPGATRGTLGDVAAELPQHRGHLDVLHALRDRDEAEVVGQLDDRADERGAARVGDQVGDEGPVDLERPQRHRAQLAHRRAADAEVVDGDPDADGGQLGQHGAGPHRVLDDRRLGDLELEGVRGQRVHRQQGGDHGVEVERRAGCARRG